eukprot:tig00021013_g17056.t1
MPEGGPGDASSVSSACSWLSVSFTVLQKGAKHAAVAGSWDGWARHVNLSAAGDMFTTEIPLKPGTYSFKYIIDGEWKVDTARPTQTDAAGNLNNIVVVDQTCTCFCNEAGDGRATPRDSKRPPVPRRRSLRVGVAVSQRKCQGAKISEDVRRRCTRMHRRIALTPFEVTVCSARDVAPAAGSALCELGALALELENSEPSAPPEEGEEEASPEQQQRRIRSVTPERSGSESAVAQPPNSPRSVPASPVHRRRLTWYDPAELPYLIRQRLGACHPNALFDPNDRHDHIQVTHAGYCATKAHPLSLYRSARCRGSIPLGTPVYFEMELVEQPQPGGFCVGLSSPEFPLSALCGARPGSVGLYSTGDFISGSRWRKHGRPFGVGDVVGLLVTLAPAVGGDGASLAHISYFLNGEPLGVPDTGGPVAFSGPVRPTLTLYSRGQRARVLAGAAEIAYPSEALRLVAPNAVAADGRPIFSAGVPRALSEFELELSDEERDRCRCAAPVHKRRLSETGAVGCGASGDADRAYDRACALSAAPTPLFYPQSTPPSVATAGQLACSL